MFDICMETLKIMKISKHKPEKDIHVYETYTHCSCSLKAFNERALFRHHISIYKNKNKC